MEPAGGTCGRNLHFSSFGIILSSLRRPRNKASSAYLRVECSWFFFGLREVLPICLEAESLVTRRFFSVMVPFYLGFIAPRCSRALSMTITARRRVQAGQDLTSQTCFQLDLRQTRRPSLHRVKRSVTCGWSAIIISRACYQLERVQLVAVSWCSDIIVASLPDYVVLPS